MPFRLDRALIRVSGPDAVSFLDKLLTQDVEQLAATGVQYAGLLSPQGKVLADMLLWPDAEAVLLDLDPSAAPDLLRRLTMYKLRARVELEPLTDSHCALWSIERFAGARPDPRLAALGWRAIAPRGDFAAAASYQAHRLGLGVPDLARDCDPEEVFAGEALLEELNGVDFHKGCFVGQENTSRMKRRATTRKKFCPVRFDGAAPAYGAPVQAGPAQIGQIRSGMETRAIALLRLDRALAAAQEGAPLTAEGREIRLDPPDWLILPASREAGSGAPD